MTQHELDAIRQSGEGYKVEFKRNLNSDFPKEVVAFANSSGGKIFIGIEDDGIISGIHVNNDLKSKIQTMARDCDPSVPVEVEVFDNILIVHVPEGKDKPYRCANGFYTRSGASSVKLSTQEIIDFIKTEGRVRFEDLHATEVNYCTDFDETALKRFYRLSGITELIGAEEILVNLGVLYNNNGSFTLINAGVLFFAKRSAQIMPHAAISCVLFKGDKKVNIIDRKIFEFDLLSNIDQAVAFLERHLNLSYEIKDIRRKEVLEIPKDVLRDALINAVAHRDYYEKGAHVVVEIFDNRVEISSPGGLPKGLSPDNFGKHSLARNPLIVGLLHRCNYIEKAGTGIQRMRDGMKEAGLPEPLFEFSGFFTVIFKRVNEAEYLNGQKLPVGIDRSDRMYKIIRQLHDKGKLDVTSIATQFNTTSRTIRRDLEMMEEYGWVSSSGVTRNKIYSLTKEGLDRIGALL